MYEMLVKVREGSVVNIDTVGPIAREIATDRFALKTHEETRELPVYLLRERLCKQQPGQDESDCENPYHPRLLRRTSAGCLDEKPARAVGCLLSVARCRHLDNAADIHTGHRGRRGSSWHADFAGEGAR